MGARITAQLYEAEEIDRNEACYLLTFCSSPSPAFLSSYVILTAFSGQIHPGFVFGVLYGSNFLTGFLFRLVFRRFRLQYTQIFGAFEHALHFAVVRRFIRLRAQALHRRAFARVEHAHL